MRMSFRERKPFFSPLTKDGYSFLHKKRIILPGADRSYRRLFSIRLEEESKIRITFQPISVHLCQEEFDGLREIIPLTDSSSSELTPRVGFEYSCLLDADGWAQHKEVLLDFASAVYDEAGANATGDSQVVPEATKDDDENDV